jgi:hypothetical protein
MKSAWRLWTSIPEIWPFYHGMSNFPFWQPTSRPKGFNSKRKLILLKNILKSLKRLRLNVKGALERQLTKLRNRHITVSVGSVAIVAYGDLNAQQEWLPAYRFGVTYMTSDAPLTSHYKPRIWILSAWRTLSVSLFQLSSTYVLQAQHLKDVDELPFVAMNMFGPAVVLLCVPLLEIYNRWKGHWSNLNNMDIARTLLL